MTAVTVCGVDGCRGGWMAVVRRPNAAPERMVAPRLAALVEALPSDAAIAVDMPIGLPAFCGRGGRGPEHHIRPHLGGRQSSVFSIPSRAAVYAADEAFSTPDRWYAAHREASAVARSTSDPARGVSIQAFAIFDKIRELDRLLRGAPLLGRRLVESHPEAAFWRMNGCRPLDLPKKIRGKINPPGMEERKALLARHGFSRAFLDAVPPPGAALDDVLDAAAVSVVAERHAEGRAIPFPDPPTFDDHGLPMAIWT